MDIKTTTVGAAHSKNCNRYQSRGARYIIHKKILPILRTYYQHSKLTNTNTNQKHAKVISSDILHSYTSDYYKILSTIFTTTTTKTPSDIISPSSLCPLNPNNDLYYPHEVYSSKTMKIRGGLQVHVCDFCQKKFHSKYYLDRHLDLHHSSDTLYIHKKENTDNRFSTPPSSSLSNNNNNASTINISNHYNNNKNDICLASAICPAFGGAQYCYDEAMKHEPFYAPGNKQKTKSPTIMDRRKSCVEEDMIQSRKLCHELFQNCFSSSENDRKIIIQDVTSHFCDKLSCSNTIHHLAGREEYHIHHIKHTWDIYHDHTIGTFGYFIVFLLILFYMIVGLCYCCMYYDSSVSSKFSSSKNGGVFGKKGCGNSMEKRRLRFKEREKRMYNSNKLE